MTGLRRPTALIAGNVTEPKITRRKMSLETILYPHVTWRGAWRGDESGGKSGINGNVCLWQRLVFVTFDDNLAEHSCARAQCGWHHRHLNDLDQVRAMTGLRRWRR